jgi:hypothetical protein
MRLLKKLFDFYIQSSLHIGLAVTCLVYITAFSNKLCQHIVYPSCVFFGTVLGYNFLKYYEIFKSGNFYSKKYLAIFIISLLALIGFGFVFLGLKPTIQIPIVVSGIFVLVYPFLRKYGWLKLFLVSFVITIVTVYIPFILKKPILLDYYISLIQRFVFITSLMIPFEILDSKTDDQSMNTLPQLLGVARTKWFGMLLIILGVILEFLKINYSISIIPVGLLTFLSIHFTTLERNKYYTSFWVESVPIIWLILVVFISC